MSHASVSLTSLLERINTENMASPSAFSAQRSQGGSENAPAGVTIEDQSTDGFKKGSYYQGTSSSHTSFDNVKGEEGK